MISANILHTVAEYFLLSINISHVTRKKWRGMCISQNNAGFVVKSLFFPPRCSLLHVCFLVCTNCFWHLLICFQINFSVTFLFDKIQLKRDTLLVMTCLFVSERGTPIAIAYAAF